ncbi:hypothetical protein JIQ42_06085 [Leishmania sp. Namibia]|uniref:hypothetical protein n=1 Tax=Leishmania sp. Namibia TaxID=2802991 RepID=UPI001B433F86|nr:hypothetical protein JIQ42_06085 [Leishmania sp. Namibia]
MQRPRVMGKLGGQTTKKTYVTTYTTEVDPRTLPDFETRGVVPAEGWRGDCAPKKRGSSARCTPSRAHDQQGHHHPPRLSYDQLPSHHSGAPPPGVGYHQHPHTSYHGEHGYNEASVSKSSPNTSVMSSAPSADKGSSHRLRKKYTTTTVTTITTTTILLPKMQEAYLFPPVTSHQVDQQHNAGGGGLPYAIAGGHTHDDAAPPQRCLQGIRDGSGTGGRLQEANITNGDRVVPSKSQRRADGEASQAWEFRQHTTNHVAMESRGRLPTLEDLGITSYFAREGARNGGAAPRRRESPYAPASNSLSNCGTPLRQQPWVAGETRCEVEGGKRHY